MPLDVATALDPARGRLGLIEDTLAAFPLGLSDLAGGYWATERQPGRPLLAIRP